MVPNSSIFYSWVMACEVHFQQCWHSEKPFLFSHDPLHRGHANSPGRHKKLSWHLHSTSFSPKAFPEKRDTLTILLLLSVFVLMSILDSIVSWSRTMFLDDPTSYFIQPFVVHSYAAVSPLVFMSTEKPIHLFWCPCVRGWQVWIFNVCTFL